MKTPRDLSGLELAEAELNPQFVASIERGQADLREDRLLARKT